MIDYSRWHNDIFYAKKNSNLSISIISNIIPFSRLFFYCQTRYGVVAFRVFAFGVFTAIGCMLYFSVFVYGAYVHFCTAIFTVHQSGKYMNFSVFFVSIYHSYSVNIMQLNLLLRDFTAFVNFLIYFYCTYL